jgi:hypothetical protein
MERATLGGVPGAGDVRSRRFGSGREYRGTFVAGRANDATFVRLLETRELIDFDGVVDGEARMLKVIVTDVSPETGMVFFQAAGA